jgi:2,4-didehydro-3-deoxy-L-rhamnonate hydrolase
MVKANEHNRFALGTFSVAGSPSFAGLVVDDKVIAVRALGRPLAAGGSMLSVLDDWDTNFGLLQSAADRAFAGEVPGELLVPVEQLRIHPPVDMPRQIFCCGANYRKHVIEYIADQGVGDTAGMSKEDRIAYATRQMDEVVAKGSPYFFSKAPSAVVGPYDFVVLPRNAEKPDWELELAVIIGRPARHVSRESAFEYIAGFTIGNDVSNRDLVFRPEMKALGADWVRGKCMPTYLPLGPFLIPAAFAGDVQNLRIKLTLNGQTMQDESTADMIFGVARQIEYLSSYVQLWPGDVILTGSPAGNGTHYNRFLHPGDVMEGSIEGLGMQRNRCIAEAPETMSARQGC